MYTRGPAVSYLLFIRAPTEGAFKVAAVQIKDVAGAEVEEVEEVAAAA